MNNITKTLKETFKPRKRRAAIGGILGPIMIVVIVIAGVGVLAAMFFDLADTASIIDSIEISNQALYTEQEFVTVQIKNNGNTALTTVSANLLIADYDLTAGAVVVDCTPGTEVALIDTAIASLNPGASVTVSGSIPTGCTVNVTDRGEYILQITADSGDEEISKTVTIRAR